MRICKATAFARILNRRYDHEFLQYTLGDHELTVIILGGMQYDLGEPETLKFKKKISLPEFIGMNFFFMAREPEV